jgi:hypothetical protein
MQFDAIVFCDFTGAISSLSTELATGAMAKNGGDIENYLASPIADYTSPIQINPAFAPAYYNRGHPVRLTSLLIALPKKLRLLISFELVLADGHDFFESFYGWPYGWNNS